MRNGDHHELLRMMDTNGVNSGYWSGTNNSGITEVAENSAFREEKPFAESPWG